MKRSLFSWHCQELLKAAYSRAEVPLIGEINGQIISAQIDRLVIEDDRIIIVDYKTNRLPPGDASEVPELYLHQMANYKEALQHIYHGHTVECFLLWTVGPNFIRLEEEVLEAYAP